MSDFISQVPRERSCSCDSQDEPCFNIQERKNIEFFFKPRTIEHHIGMAFRELKGETNEKGCFEDYELQMDDYQIPDPDGLRDALMT